MLLYSYSSEFTFIQAVTASDDNAVQFALSHHVRLQIA